MIQFELTDVIQMVIVVFLAGGVYFVMQYKISALKAENNAVREDQKALKLEMNTMHSAQNEEIQEMKNDNHSIKTDVAVMVEGQKGMKDILLRVETALNNHILKEV